MAIIQVQPPDIHNQALVANVHPPDWVNPEPASRYNLVVVGAGTAGLVTAAGAAGLGAKVALIERDLMGGDCLNVGCVPSKALIRSARAVIQVREAKELGIEVAPGTQVHFAAIMERVRRLRAGLSPHDSAGRFRSLGVDVFLGEGKFVGPDAMAVGGATLRFRKAVIATGARAARPPIPGLAEAGYLTNESVFTLTELPRRLAVIGAGPIGCELAQAFACLGAQVTLIGNHAQVMPREDADAAALVETAIRRDGVEVHHNCQVLEVKKDGADKIVCFTDGGETKEVRADAILVGTGRAPNVQGLNLANAGVAYDDKKGVHVNDRLQTSNRRIFAAGDICSAFKFTHAADAMARIAIQNALFLGRAKASALTIPWCTYTNPEVAHVGLSEALARETGVPVTTFRQPLGEVDRAVLDGETIGFVKIHVRTGTDKIVGATIVARHAGEMISELTLAMVARLGLRTLARTIHSYPTQAEAIKKAADAYQRTRLTPRLQVVFRKWFAWTR
jgi:pyruvate/2-oxoglutarate dehydrogenase complex dihydrolipoamide dehydrogenase (E3) component